MNLEEEKIIADGFFKVLEAAYRHGALSKYMDINGRAQAEAADAVGLKVGDMMNAFDLMGEEQVRNGEAALEKLVPFLDILASDALWAAISRLLDYEVVKQWLWEREKKSITGVERNPLKESIGAMFLETLQIINASPEEKNRFAQMFEIVLQVVGQKSKPALKEAV